MRAQESAVFEVLIGTFLLSMVLALGYFVISRYSGQTCEMELASEVKNLAVAIENVVNGDIGTKTSLRLALPLCKGSGYAGIKIVRHNNKSICKAVCQSPTDYCITLDYMEGRLRKDGVEILTAGSVCLRIPYATEFSTNAQCPEGMEPVDPTSPPDRLGTGYLDVTHTRLISLYRPPTFFSGAVVFCVEGGRG